MVAGRTKFAKLAKASASSDVFITEELATLASDYSVVNADEHLERQSRIEVYKASS